MSDQDGALVRDPAWTEYKKKSGLDPLGMQNSSINLYQRLLPGISNVTLRVRYYGFYAWLASIYLTYQLISIPFALPAARGRFLGVFDGMASLLPLAVVLIVVFGKPQLLGTAERWEAAFLLMFVTAVDLFGGYAFNIALSRRTLDVTPAASL